MTIGMPLPTILRGIQWSVLQHIVHVGNELNYFKYLPLIAIHCAAMNQCLSAIASAMDPECLGLNADLGIRSKVELCRSMPSVCRHFGEYNHTKTLPFVASSWVTSPWRFCWRVVISFRRFGALTPCILWNCAVELGVHNLLYFGDL